MRQLTFDFWEPREGKPVKRVSVRLRLRVPRKRDKPLPLFDVVHCPRRTAFTDQEIGRHRAIETAEQNKIAKRAKRCPTCGGKVYVWPCLVCTLRANSAQTPKH